MKDKPAFPMTYGKAPNKSRCIQMTVTVFCSVRFGDVAIASTKPAATGALWKKLAPKGHVYDPNKAQQVVMFSADNTLIGEESRELPPESPWEMMDTAPKNGTEVLLIVKSRAGMPHGKLVGHYMGGGHCISDHPPIDEGWYFWNGCMFDRAAQQLMWMPLPEVNQEALNKLANAAKAKEVAA